MTSVYSINAENSRCLIDGIYSCFIRQKDIVITDGRNEWSIAQADLLDLEERLTTIINGKADASHSHVISDVNGLQDELDGKASTSHNHDSTYAGISHSHEIGNIYKTITVVDSNTGTSSTTYKPLETLLNERENDIRALINGKANSSHTHNATEIAYKDNKNVKEELDRINSRMSKTTAAGVAVDLFDVIFGTAADIGLQSEVSQLQAEIAALQAQLTTNGIMDMSDNVLEGFDSLGDTTQGVSTFQRLINTISSLFHRIIASLRGFSQVTTYTVEPLLGAIAL